MKHASKQTYEQTSNETHALGSLAAIEDGSKRAWQQPGAQAMMALLLSFLLATIALVTIGAQPRPTHGCGGWLHSSEGWSCHRMAPNYELYYKANGTTLDFGLDVWPTDTSDLTQLDWVGIGISEAGGMSGADIAMLSRDEDAPGGWMLQDMFARAPGRPSRDDSQDKTLISVQERSDGRIRARLSLPMASCDQVNDRPVRVGLPSYLIYAFGQGAFNYHGTQNRGEATVLLVPATPAAGSAPAGPANDTKTNNGGRNTTTVPTSAPARSRRNLVSRPSGLSGSVRTMEMFMPAITIPTNDTDPYICVDFELPGTLAQPLHMIDFTTIVNTTTGPSQARYVHHLVLYNCTGKPPTFGGAPYSCLGNPEMCSTFILVSTSPGLYELPKEAGFRLGEGAMRYVTLQIHYNNVNLDEGLVDSSGFTVTYTPQLRPNDMGVLTLGMTGFQVPPMARYSTGPNLCPPGCTRRMKQPVTMVSNLLHMHQIGRTMSTQHYRQLTINGTVRWVELEPTGIRNYYDFGFQPFMAILNRTSTLMPGDTLITTCNYTNPHNHTVYFGLRSSDEMCYNFVMYYPLSEVVYCGEYPELRETGLALCDGVNDTELLEQLYSLGPNATSDEQASVINALIDASILVPRNETLANITADDMPYIAPIPAACPGA